MKTFDDFGIDTRGKTSGEVKTICPRCSSSRRKKNYPCLNLNLDKGVWNCWHCSWAGSLHAGEEMRSHTRSTPLVYRKPSYHPTALPAEVIDWFATRGIPESVLVRNRIGYGEVYMPQVEEDVSAIQFPYHRNGEVLNCKYRDDQKNFRMASGAERLLYGIDDVAGDTVFICEGEIDKLSIEVAGLLSCVSVPDGAPAVTAKNYESKFDFLVSAEDLFQPMRRIVIAVDTDGPGHKLAEELARRLGPERCWRVEWSAGCKDANDVLKNYGAGALRACLDRAQPWPVKGIVTISMLSLALKDLYAHGMPRGDSTGWVEFDKFYTVRPGELTVVTGIPSHGKSFLVSALAINMAQGSGWRFAIFSPENAPLERYAALLIEQFVGKRYLDGGGMSPTQRESGQEWLNEYVSFLSPEETDPTVDALLDLARVQVYRQGIKGLILDPWTEMEHTRPAGQTETEYISKALSQIRRFARLHGVHVWVVAHPTKLRKVEKGDMVGQYPVPTPYDISGSSHWRNKADNCLSIWRNVEANDNRVQVHIQKIRFREIGKPGGVELIFDPSCGRFHEPRLEDQAWSTGNGVSNGVSSGR